MGSAEVLDSRAANDTAAAADPPGRPRPAREARRQPAPWGALDRGLVVGLVVLLVLTPRLGIPVSDTFVSIALPLTYVVAAVLLVRGRLTTSRLRFELLLLAVTACLTATAVVAFQGRQFSTPSLFLLVAVYVPWVLRVAGDRGPEMVALAGRTFVRVMLGVASVGILQLGSQLLGLWSYEDYIGEFLPRDLLIPLYNTDSPLFYDSPIYKAQAFVMLEPSFLSQYCALAVLVGLMLKVRAWQLLLLVLGLASAVSGTGVILLAAGLLIMLLRSPRRIRPTYVVVGSIALALVLLSPVAPLLLERSGEISQPSSSGYARFSAPYTELAKGLEAEPSRYLVGAGPGAVDRLLPSQRDGIGAAILYGVVPKLTFEYGLLAGGLFMLFLLLGLLDGAPWRVVPGALVVMIFALSGALLQPQTASLAWLLTGFGASDRPRGP